MSGTKASGSGPIVYPECKPGETVENLHGIEVADPFRHLEDPASAGTQEWVKAQVACTRDYFASSGAASLATELAGKLKEVWTYDKVYPPTKRGDWFYFFKKAGTANQPIVMRTRSATEKGLVEDAEEFLNLNASFPDGKMAMRGWYPSPCDRYVAYGLSRGGSDWFQIRVRSTETGKDLVDVVPWCRYSGVTWMKDGSGFFYSRYAAPAGVSISSVLSPGEAPPVIDEAAAAIAAIAQPDGASATSAPSLDAGTETAQAREQMVYFHRLGTEPSQDLHVYTTPHSEW
jgi:prolyl oligopeptidase